jgi:hypothetical protein
MSKRKYTKRKIVVENIRTTKKTIKSKFRKREAKKG